MRARLFGQMVLLLAIVNIAPMLGAIAAQAAGQPRPVRIVVLGDSLSAGYGLGPGEAFPEVLAKQMNASARHIEIANAGVSGDTTAAGLARLDWAVPDGTDAVILELGANDALRGLPVADARANLETIVNRLKSRGIEVLLAGMRAPRNLGDTYANAFDQIFPDLAEKYGLIRYPFFLTGVVLDPHLNQSDGMHPTAEGVRVIARRIEPSVEELIARVQHRRITPTGG